MTHGRGRSIADETQVDAYDVCDPRLRRQSIVMRHESLKILERFQKAFRHRNIQLADLAELAWAEKAPELIRERVLHRIKDNPLFGWKLIPQEVQMPVAAGERR